LPDRPWASAFGQHRTIGEIHEQAKAEWSATGTRRPARWQVHRRPQRQGQRQPLPFFGIASEIRAIDLPFIVVKPVNGSDTATIDVRYLNLMTVKQEFVEAQSPQQAMVGLNRSEKAV